MAIHRLFLCKDAEGMVGLSTHYTYHDDILTLNWRGEIRKFRFPSPIALVIKCDGNFPEPALLMTPVKMTDRLHWLCGTLKPKRASSIYDYERRVEAYRASEDARPIIETEGPGWKVCEAKRIDGNGFFVVTAWCSENISISGIKSLLGMHGLSIFPQWFIDNLLYINHEDSAA